MPRPASPNVVEFLNGDDPQWGTVLWNESDATWLVLLREDGRRKVRLPMSTIRRVEDREVPAHAPPRHHAIS